MILLAGVNQDHILPSQDYLKKDTIDFILSCYTNGDIEKLPPIPFIRKHPFREDMYVAIDGHNLIAVHIMLRKSLSCYIVSGAEDMLENPDDRLDVSKRNIELREKFESSVVEADKLSLTFKKLLLQYNYL